MERVNVEAHIKDPRKRELLEARLIGNQGQSGSESNMSATSSIGGPVGSDKDNDSVLSIQDMLSTTEKGTNKKAKKRKADEPKKPNTIANTKATIQQYLIDSPAKHSRNSQSYIHASPSSRGVVEGGGFTGRSVFQKTANISKEHKETQTDLNYHQIDVLESRSSALQNDESKYNETNMRNNALLQQLQKTKNLALQNKKQADDSANFIRDLLIQNARAEKAEARKSSMTARLRLGQFVRNGSGHYMRDERWSNGHAFDRVTAEKERIQREKADIEQKRKLLNKKKPAIINNRNKASTDESKSKKTAESESKDVFSVPEYHEQDEVLKQRVNAVKREEIALQAELDRLERERSLHIRELKRITNEDSSQFNDHKILNKRYLLLTMLGKGGFSEVYKGFDLENLRYVAVKIHHLNREWNEQKKVDYARHANRESEIHRTVDHRRIVSLYDRFEVDINTFCTVLEFCEGNDLDFYLKQNKTMTEKEARTIIMQVVSALYYLNNLKRPVIHYDLKPGNILLCNGTVCGDIKITDFGLSKRLEAGQGPDEGMELTSQGAGTYWYLPPECFLRMEGGHPPIIDNKVDVWSVGVIFYQCLFGRKPFGHNQTQESILKNDTILNARDIVFPAKPAISSEAKSFIRACLAYRKEERADVFQLYRHNYLQPNSIKRQMTISSTNHHGNNTQNGSSNSSSYLFAHH